MKIYQSCGELSIDSTTNQKSLNVKTMLPDLKHGGKYEYIEFFNISSKDHYGVLGVLKVNVEANIDLREYQTDKIELTKIGGPIYLHGFSNFNGGMDFGNLNHGDVVTFICHHDNNFAANNPNDILLKEYQSMLNGTSTGLEFPQNKTTIKTMIVQPKIGNGGILTVNGCRF